MTPLQTITRRIQAYYPELQEVVVDISDLEMMVTFDVNPKFHWVNTTDTPSELVERNNRENRIKYRLESRLMDLEKEILVGHPIQLHHVLRAMATQRVRVVYSATNVACFDEYKECDVFTHEQSWQYQAGWDLSKDLSGQSEETVNWLLTVIK